MLTNMKNWTTHFMHLVSVRFEMPLVATNNMPLRGILHITEQKLNQKQGMEKRQKW